MKIQIVKSYSGQHYAIAPISKMWRRVHFVNGEPVLTPRIRMSKKMRLKLKGHPAYAVHPARNPVR